MCSSENNIFSEYNLWLFRYIGLTLKSLHSLSFTINIKCIDLFLMELVGLMEHMEHLKLTKLNNNHK